MTAHPPLPTYLQPASKASSTSKSTHLSAIANSTPTTSRSSSQGRPSRTRQNATKSEEYTSEKATATLIRRVLGPQPTGIDPRNSPPPIKDILPSLTSSNEVDSQLYAIIAVVVKDFVQVWYSKITPDHVFVEEVVQIIAHCSRGVEQRLRRIDIEELIFDEIPALIEAHIYAYRTAHETFPPSAYQSDPRRTYHALNPHPALSPFPDAEKVGERHSQASNEIVYRQMLVQGALAVLLPIEDLQNGCLRTLVSDVVADLILGQGISGRACEGWFLHETCIKVVEVVKSRIEPKAKGEEIEHDTRSRLERFGLLSPKDGESPSHLSKEDQSLALALFWRVLQYAYLFFLLARFVIVGLLRARSLPSRSYSFQSIPPSPIAKSAGGLSTTSRSWSTLPSPPKRPILDYRLFALLSTLLDLSTRMPWLTGLLALCKHGLLTGPGGFAAVDGLLGKFLHNTLTTHITPWPTLLPTILLNLRVALFPFNSRNLPAPPLPTPEEQLEIRRRAAEAILGLIPRLVARVYFATSNNSNGGNDEKGRETDSDDEVFEDMIGQIEEMLDVFGDAYMNKHLVYSILELVFVRLIPEMGERSTSELLMERGVALRDWDEAVDVNDGRGDVVGEGKGEG